MIINLIFIILAIILFFLVNIIGNNTPFTLKYNQFSSFIESNESPAFNFTIRVLSPTIYIILLSSIFYTLKFDFLVINIYYISIYYVLIRTMYNLIIGRALLINWIKQTFYSVCIILISYLFYDKLIINKKNLLPDFTTVSNELWIMIFIFLYSIINNINFSNDKAILRKNKYISTKYNLFSKKYSKIIDSKTDNLRLKQIILAIIIYENFNRPKIYRYFEIVSHFFRIKKNHTLGIMQVSSAKIISDEESVEIGTKILINKYYELEKKYKKLVDKSEYNDRDFQIKLVNFYNLGYSYSNEIINIADEINDLEYNSNYKYLFFNNLNNDSKIKKLINKYIIKSICKYFIKFLN